MTTKNRSYAALGPVALLGAVTGLLSGAVTTIYKLLAKHAAALFQWSGSATANDLPTLVIMVLLSVLLAKIYRKAPELQGGGIPASISAIRGLRPLSWLRNTLGPFFLSLLSIALGVPLGTEGPSVQFSTAIGGGLLQLFPKKWHIWKPYALTAGASAGFAAATGAPLAGLVFSAEEAHQKVSPLILLSAGTAAVTAQFVSRLLSPLLGVEFVLFSVSSVPWLHWRDLWLPLTMGLVMGLFSAGFMLVHSLLRNLHQKTAKKCPQAILIFAVLVCVFIAARISPNFVSTGHHLVLDLLQQAPGTVFLLAIVVVRTGLTLSATTIGITGGTFLPQLAIGAAAAACAGSVLVSLGVPETCYPLLVLFGLCGCMAGMMKMPITAIAFSLEVLGLTQNLLPMLLVVAVSYLPTKVWKLHSVCEYVLEHTAPQVQNQ